MTNRVQKIHSRALTNASLDERGQQVEDSSVQLSNLGETIQRKDSMFDQSVAGSIIRNKASKKLVIQSKSGVQTGKNMQNSPYKPQGASQFVLRQRKKQQEAMKKSVQKSSQFFSERKQGTDTRIGSVASSQEVVF